MFHVNDLCKDSICKGCKNNYLSFLLEKDAQTIVFNTQNFLSFSSYQQQLINVKNTIEQDLNLIDNKCQITTQKIGHQLPKNGLNQMSKAYFVNLANHGQMMDDKHLQNSLLQMIEQTSNYANTIDNNTYQMMNDDVLTTDSFHKTNQSKPERKIAKLQNILIIERKIIIQKQREVKTDQIVFNQRKQARSNFYSHQIQQLLISAKINERKREQIIKHFMLKQNNRKMYVSLDKFQELKKCWNEAHELKHSFQSQETEFIKKEKECRVITQMAQLKLDCLKVIHIEYKQKFQNYQHQNRYAVSAFELFKVVHENKYLTQVTLKGVLVQQFTQFISLAKSIRQQCQRVEEDQQHAWMKNFNPSKSLQLAINTEVFFRIQQKQEAIVNQAKDLAFFARLFYCLSDITVKIVFKQCSEIQSAGNSLAILWNSLAIVKNMKLIIKAYRFGIQIAAKQVPTIRSLFAGFATLNNISHLHLQGFSFDKQTNLNDFLVLEEILGYAFLNNRIISLQLYSCSDFFKLPPIITLQTIRILWASFRLTSDTVNKVFLANKSLKFIELHGVSQRWSIGQQLFNQLQTLIIDNCERFDLKINSQSPLNFKSLSLLRPILQSSAEKYLEYFSIIAPRLCHLRYLELSGINFDYQLLSSIPSILLDQLHIRNNHTITNKGLQGIDSKWQSLRYFEIKYCKNISESAWSKCQFKGLLKLTVESHMLGQEKKALYELKSKGIIVDCSL